MHQPRLRYEDVGKHGKQGFLHATGASVFCLSYTSFGKFFVFQTLIWQKAHVELAR